MACITAHIVGYSHRITWPEARGHTHTWPSQRSGAELRGFRLIYYHIQLNPTRSQPTLVLIPRGAGTWIPLVEEESQWDSDRLEIGTVEHINSHTTIVIFIVAACRLLEL